MRLLHWLFRGFLFFLLFAFALNNQEEATVHWFFGQSWRAPMVYVVLAAFGLGCALGVLAVLPSWWRHRRRAMGRTAEDAETVAPPAPGPAEPPDTLSPPLPDLPAPRGAARRGGR